MYNAKVKTTPLLRFSAWNSLLQGKTVIQVDFSLEWHYIIWDGNKIFCIYTLRIG